METKFFNEMQKVADLNNDCKHWISTFKFMDEEQIFIRKLLESYVFEPNTPNLFERLQDYKMRLIEEKKLMQTIENKVLAHENILGGMLECNQEQGDVAFYNTHNALKMEVLHSFEAFKILKSEIFNYAGGILKNRKP